LAEKSPIFTMLRWDRKAMYLLGQRLLLTSFASLMLHPHDALAQQPESERVRENLDATNSNLEASTSRQMQLANEVAKAIAGEQDVSNRLIAAGQGIASLEQALATTESRLRDLDEEHSKLSDDLAAKQDTLSELLAALQVLEQNPPPALVVEPRDILQALRGAMMFGAVVPEMRDAATLLVNQLERLDSIKQETEAARADASSQIATLATAYRDLEILQREKQTQGANATASLEAERKLAARLAKQSQNLQDLLASLDKAEADRQKALSEEAARKEAERQRQLEALNQPRIRLSTARGQLAYPVQGRIVGRFGDDNGLDSSLSGLVIAAREGLQVRSPVDGRIEFAGPFRSYGQLLIIDGGEGYLVVLAGMEQVSAARGQSVRMGEPVGRMGRTPSSVAVVGKTAASLTPVLYIEFRKNGKPVDSTPWWIGSRKEARQ
jgi:murein hydrolase activator